MLTNSNQVAQISSNLEPRKENRRRRGNHKWGSRAKERGPLGIGYFLRKALAH